MTDQAQPTPATTPTTKGPPGPWAGVVVVFIVSQVAGGYFKTWGETLRNSGADERLLVLFGTGLLYAGTALRALFWPAVFGALAYWLALREIRKERDQRMTEIHLTLELLLDEQTRSTSEAMAKLRAELRPPYSTDAMARALRNRGAPPKVK